MVCQNPCRGSGLISGVRGYIGLSMNIGRATWLYIFQEIIVQFRIRAQFQLPLQRLSLVNRMFKPDHDDYLPCDRG